MKPCLISNSVSDILRMIQKMRIAENTIMECVCRKTFYSFVNVVAIIVEKNVDS